MVATTDAKFFNDTSLFKALTSLSSSLLLRRDRYGGDSIAAMWFCGSSRASDRAEGRRERRMDERHQSASRGKRPSMIARPRAKSRRLARATRRIAGLALVLAVLGAALLGSASVGYRFGWWGLGPAFTMLQISAYAAVIVAIVALIGLALALMARHWTSVAAAVLATLLAAGTAAVPLAMQRTARSVPVIHDITTDTEHPPEFVTLRSLRERTSNGVAYGGPAVASEQKQAYPDLAPLRLPVPPDRAFALAEATARSLGWDVVSASPAEGRLEATDTTRWFRFKDDVVVRVVPVSGGSRIDVRSVSRVGRSDLGANARRVRAFLAALSARGRG